jgi:inward rectifier potassium channel
MAEKPEKRRARDEPPVRVIGIARHPIRDIYHGALRLPWTSTLLGIALVFLALNAIFAVLYLALGGIAHARPGSFTDAFFFSVQTMGTIGYGAMYPESVAANVLVVTEAIVSMIVTAVVTGLVFAKFSRSSARVVFSKHAVISPMDGIPTLAFRVGNERASLIYEATMRISMVRTEVTKEGHTFYRLYDLQLVRDRSQALARSWTVMHRVDEKSPLFGHTAASLEKDEVELLVTITGTDDISLQPVHARHTYYYDEIAWNSRHKDILREDGAGLVLDLTRFHDIEPST